MFRKPTAPLEVPTIRKKPEPSSKPWWSWSRIGVDPLPDYWRKPIPHVENAIRGLLVLAVLILGGIGVWAGLRLTLWGISHGGLGF